MGGDPHRRLASIKTLSKDPKANFNLNQSSALLTCTSKTSSRLLQFRSIRHGALGIHYNEGGQNRCEDRGSRAPTVHYQFGPARAAADGRSRAHGAFRRGCRNAGRIISRVAFMRPPAPHGAFCEGYFGPKWCQSRELELGRARGPPRARRRGRAHGSQKPVLPWSKLQKAMPASSQPQGVEWVWASGGGDGTPASVASMWKFSVAV